MRILHVTAQKPDSTGSGVYLTKLVEALCTLSQDSQDVLEQAGVNDKVGILIEAQAVVAGIDVADTPQLPEGVVLYPVRFQTPELPFPVCGMSDVMPYDATRYRDLTPKMLEQFEEAFAQVLDCAVAQFRPDAIVCHHLYLLTAIVRERFPQLPVVAVCHSTCLRQLSHHDLERERIVSAIGQLDRVLALHEAQRLQILETFGMKPERVSVIGTGCDVEFFKSGGPMLLAQERKAKAQGAPFALSKQTDDGSLVSASDSSKGSEHIDIVYAGKIGFMKGVASLIRSLDELPYPEEQITLRLCGGASNPQEYEEIERLARKCRYDVRFLGKLSQEELACEYHRADVFVLPSFFEGLPLVAIEALSGGCRVVMTELPGLREWMDSSLPDAPVWFVEPPHMQEVGVPEPSELPAYEKRLAHALEACIQAPCQMCDTSGLSWNALGQRVLAMLEPLCPSVAPCEE